MGSTMLCVSTVPVAEAGSSGLRQRDVCHDTHEHLPARRMMTAAAGPPSCPAPCLTVPSNKTHNSWADVSLAYRGSSCAARQFARHSQDLHAATKFAAYSGAKLLKLK